MSPAGEHRAYVQSRYGQIHLRRQGEGPTVLLAHANPWSSLFWAPVLPLLAGAGFCAVAYDAPGYGLSDRAAAALTIEGQADVMADVAAALGGAAAVIGWHQGAVVGLDFAVRDPVACPVLVMDGAGTATDDQALGLAHAVLANNPAYAFAGNEGHWWVDMALGRLRLFNPHFRLDADTWPLFRDFLQGTLQVDPAIAASPSPMVPAAVRAALSPDKAATIDVAYYDWVAALADVRCPLLLLTAEDEPLRPAHAATRAAAAHAPVLAEFTYPGGHPLIGIGRADAYLAPILAFLCAHVPRAS